MIYGPCGYIPPTEVEVLERRAKIPLDKNEGIYVRDTRTGGVRTVFGEAYMLKSHEELWCMDLPENVEKLLAPSYFHTQGKREKHKVVSFRAPFNTAVQVYDYKKKSSRIVFGPKLVTLEPDEVFTQSALSG
jgi:major vault protein